MTTHKLTDILRMYTADATPGIIGKEVEMKEPYHSSGGAEAREPDDNAQEPLKRQAGSSRAGVYAPKPVLFAVDAGAESFRRIEYGLRRRYAIEYQVVCESSARWGMKRLRELK